MQQIIRTIMAPLVHAPAWLVSVLAAHILVLSALPAPAADDDMQRLFALVRLDDTVKIMRAEGLEHAAVLGESMLPQGDASGWALTVDRLYDEDAMIESVRQGFADSFGDAELAPLVRFFGTATGRAIIDREIEARPLMDDKAIEEMARNVYRDRAAENDPRVALIARYAEVNDLLGYNVAGALNANYQFFRGLADGGAILMSEEELIATVWADEDSIRKDTREWLMAYLLMAYQPLQDAQVEAYVDLSSTPAGQAFNRALFAGFERMYRDVSYALGLALAREQASDAL